MKRIRPWLVPALILVLSCAVPFSLPVDLEPTVRLAPPDQTLQVWLGRSELVPDQPVPMAGFGTRYRKKSLGVHDPIFARCIIFKQGGKRMAIVSADILIMTAQLRLAVLDKVKDLSLDAVLLATTHTHSGPGGYIKSFVWELAAMGVYDQNVFDFLAEALAGSIRNAAESTPFEAKVGTGQIDVPEFVANRRHEGGETDPSLAVIRIDDFEGRTRAMIVNYGAHATVMLASNRLLSGDYAGELERALEERVELAMYLAGDIGDQKPHLPDLERDPYTFEHAYEMGRGLAERAWKMSQTIATRRVAISQVGQQIEMPPGDLNKHCVSILHAPLEAPARRILPKSTLLQAWRLGDALLLASPGEIAHEIGMEFRTRFPDNVVLPTAHSNDYVGYIISEKEYAMGGYESCMNFYGPGFASILVDTMTRLGNELR